MENGWNVIMRRKCYVIIPCLSLFFIFFPPKWPPLQGIMPQESIVARFICSSWLKAKAESNEDYEVLAKHTVS